MNKAAAYTKLNAALAKARADKDTAFNKAEFDLRMAESRARGRYSRKDRATNPDVGERVTRLCDKAKSDYHAAKVLAHERYLAAGTLAHEEYLADIAEPTQEWEDGL